MPSTKTKAKGNFSMAGKNTTLKKFPIFINISEHLSVNHGNVVSASWLRASAMLLLPTRKF